MSPVLSGKKRRTAPFEKESDEPVVAPPSPKRLDAGTSLTTLVPITYPTKETSFHSFLMQQQLDTFQSELEHERSLRVLDQKRFRQTQQRLEKQIEFAKEEADQAKTLLTQWQHKHENITEQLRGARNAALAELRQCHIEREQLQQVSQTPDDAVTRLWQDKCYRLEAQVDAQKLREAALEAEIASLARDVKEKFKAQEEALQTKSAVALPWLEHADPAVIKELNRIRLLLAESECRERQLQRKKDELESRMKAIGKEREQARLTGQRLITVEHELSELRGQHEIMAAEHTTWKSFGDAMLAQLKRQNMALQDGTNGPPEISTIIRFMDQAQTRAEEHEKQMKRLQADCERLKSETLPSAAKSKDLQDAIENSMKERHILATQLDAAERKIAMLESQLTISNREKESLRSLVKTFDGMPLATNITAQDILASPKLDSKLKQSEIRLSSIRQELDAMTSEHQRLVNELELATKEKDEKCKELDVVREKFGKLREALQAEKAKVELLEQRANQAETLAGKGSFNPDKTRILHVKDTPLIEALKEEVEVLKRQLDVVNKGGKAPNLAVDPEKLNQRLKENFKEQITLFREGVYIMTGYKVDMLPSTDRPTFRVRSVYAEHEEDHLMFKWPTGDAVSSLDLLHTDFAKALSFTPSYEYMTKFHSLPGFLASVQLSLFEKQTLPVH